MNKQIVLFPILVVLIVLFIGTLVDDKTTATVNVDGQEYVTK